jgi:hypothetical protein
MVNKMEKDIVVLGLDHYDQLREMEKNQEKIAWYNASASRAEYQYIGKDESIKRLMDSLRQKDSLIMTLGRYSYPSNFVARIRFLFTGRINIRS